MCGRFTLRTPLSRLIQQFLLDTGENLVPRYNIAPTQSVAAVRVGKTGEGRELAMMRWGLIPSWAKDAKIGNRMINARSETVGERPAFRAAYRRRRCVVLADGYYEWQKIGKQKQPYYIRMCDERPFGMAGLWETWKSADDSPIESCTILTTTANERTQSLHDRMPVILRDEDWDGWLDVSDASDERLQPLMVPFSSAEMTYDPVSTHVNSPRNEDESCIVIQSEPL